MAHAKVQPHGAALFIAAAASVVFLVSGITSVLSGQLGGTPPPALVVDDSDKTGFSAEGSFWYRTSAPTAHKKNLRVTSLMNMYFANQKAPSALWTASLQPGTYDVQMTWQAKSFLTDSATVTVQNGGTPLLPAMTLNQKKAPVGEKTEQVTWQSLGDITVDVQTQVSVRLTGPAKSPTYKPQINGLQMTADAVRFVKKREPEMTVQVYSGFEEGTVVRNQKNVTFLRFEAGASKEFDRPVVTKAVFTADSGSPLNAQNYALWMDVDGDGETETLVQDGVYAENDLIVFDGLGEGGIPLTIQSRHFEVRGDIASSTVNDTLRLRFADVDDVLMAEDAATGAPLVGVDRNGSCKECAIHLSDANAVTTEYRIIAQGNLYVTKDTMPLRSHQLLGGTLGDAVLLIRLRAENEDVDVTDLQLTSHAGTATSVERLELYTMGSTTPFAVATTSACGSDNVPTADFNGEPAQTFCANMESGQLVIPEGNTVSVSVRPRMKTDQAGAVSGENIALFMNDAAVSDNMTSEGAVRARGAVSGADLSANDGDDSATGEVFIGRDAPGPNEQIRGNMNHVVLSKLVSITNANPDADNSPVPTGISAIGQFKFTAAANMNYLNGQNKVTLDGIIFNVNASNVEFGAQSFKLYNKADTSTKRSCAVVNPQGMQIGGEGTGVSGSLYIVCDNLKEDAVSTEIGSGSIILALEGEVTRRGMSTGVSTLQVSLSEFSNIAKNDAFGWNQSHLKWFDEDTTQTVFRWMESDNTVIRSTKYQFESWIISSSSSSSRISSSGQPGTCTSTSQCSNGMRCSTEWSDCKPAICPPGMMCPDVCTGTCMYVDRSSSSSSRMSSRRSSALSSSSNDNDIMPMPVIYDTQRGKGPYDKMTYESYKSTIVLKAKKDMRVSQLSPDVYFCNGSCTVRMTISRPNTLLPDLQEQRTLVQTFDAPGALADDALRKYFTVQAYLTLVANTEYTITTEVETTQSVGIYTAGAEATRDQGNATYRFVSAIASYGMDATQRGPIAFRIHGTLFASSSSSTQSSTCITTAQCSNGMLCSTEWGDCQQTLCPSGLTCPDVCTGTCKYVDRSSSSRSSMHSSMPRATADVAVAMSGPTEVKREGTFSPNIFINNMGPGQATVHLSVTIPRGFSVRLTESDRQYCSLTPDTVTCAFPPMSAGALKNIGTLVFTAGADAQCTSPTFITAIIDHNAMDPDTGNNRSLFAFLTSCDNALKSKCQDGIDNDGDFLIDTADLGCTSPDDNDESNALVNNSACTEFRSDGKIVAGKPFTMFVTVQNTGTKAWRAPKHYIFDTDWTQKVQWGNSSWPMPTEQVNPLKSVTFTVNGTAPGTPGTYRMNVRMVESTAEAFGTTCWKNIVVEKASE